MSETTEPIPDTKPETQVERLTRLRDERRIRLAEVPHQFILSMLNLGICWDVEAMGKARAELHLPVLMRDLPPDAWVLSVIWAPERDSFVAVVCSQTFDRVPDGQSAPWFGTRQNVAIRAVPVEVKAETEVQIENAPVEEAKG